MGLWRTSILGLYDTPLIYFHYIKTRAHFAFNIPFLIKTPGLPSFIWTFEHLINAHLLVSYDPTFLPTSFKSPVTTRLSPTCHSKCLPQTNRPRPFPTHHQPTPPSPALQHWRATHQPSGTRLSRKRRPQRPRSPMIPKKQTSKTKRTRKSCCTVKLLWPTSLYVECELARVYTGPPVLHKMGRDPAVCLFALNVVIRLDETTLALHLWPLAPEASMMEWYRYHLFNFNCMLCW